LKHRESAQSDFRRLVSRSVSLPKVRQVAKFVPKVKAALPVIQPYVPPVLYEIAESVVNISSIRVSEEVLERKVLHEEVIKRKDILQESRNRFEQLKLSSFEETVETFGKDKFTPDDEVIEGQVENEEDLNHDDDLLQRIEEGKMEVHFESRNNEEEMKMKIDKKENSVEHKGILEGVFDLFRKKY
jgi:predicted DNA-binding protein